jgi:tellurite resistance protein
MTTMLEILEPAIDQLCLAFERGGYTPTPIIDLGVLVASADGTVDESEREMLRDVFQTLMDTKITAEVVDALVTASVSVIEQAGAESRAKLIAAILQDCDAVEDGVLVALAIAFASQGLSKAEQRVVERIAAAAELEPARLEVLTEKVRKYAAGGPISVRVSLTPNPPPSARP